MIWVLRTESILFNNFFMVNKYLTSAPCEILIIILLLYYYHNKKLKILYSDKLKIFCLDFTMLFIEFLNLSSFGIVLEKSIYIEGTLKNFNISFQFSVSIHIQQQIC